MMSSISFTVPGNPLALKRHRHTNKGFSYDPSKNDKADFLAKAMQHRPDKPFDKPLCVWMGFYFPRPKSHYNKKGLKENAPSFVQKRPDIDNLVKFVADALNGIFWNDDAIIVILHAAKHYSTTPRVDLKIEEARL